MLHTLLDLSTAGRADTAPSTHRGIAASSPGGGAAATRRRATCRAWAACVRHGVLPSLEVSPLTLLLHSSYTPLTQPARMHVLTACMHVVATRRLPSHTARTAPSVQALTQLDGGAARAARGSGGAARLALELPELHGLAAALGRSQQPSPRGYMPMELN